MPETPLSDAITRMNEHNDRVTYTRVLEALGTARFGIVASDIPADVPRGVPVRMDVPYCVGYTRHPSHLAGPDFVLACADPDVFRTRFPDRGFNADVSARAIYAIVLANPETGGLLINSAIGLHSVTIDHATIARLQRGDRPCAITGLRRWPWWKWWDP